MRTMRNILRHEFIGLMCEVVSSKNKDHIGVKGKVTDETLKTIVIGKKQIQKKGTKFRVILDDKNKVDIDGNHLLSRPEDRIKKKIKKW